MRATQDLATTETLAAAESLAGTEIVIRPAVVAKWTFATIGLIVTASITGQIVKFALGYDHALGLVPFTYVDGEANLPTFYSSTALLACALVAAPIAVHKWRTADAYAWHWCLVVAALALLALDEAAELHEMIGRAVPGMWTNIAIPVVLAGTAAFIPFLRSLPRTTRALLILGGAVFVAGAVGMEMVGHRYTPVFGSESITYVAMVTIEETLEMTGVAIVLYALLDYARGTVATVRIRLDRA